MENRKYRCADARPRSKVEVPACIVGVVASGNLEVLIEPAELGGACTLEVATPSAGYGAIWDAVVADFFARYALADTRVAINDNGATPAVVALRLAQAAEEFVAGQAEVK